jgi:hypothetical protein
VVLPLENIKQWSKKESDLARLVTPLLTGPRDPGSNLGITEFKM